MKKFAEFIAEGKMDVDYKPKWSDAQHVKSHVDNFSSIIGTGQGTDSMTPWHYEQMKQHAATISSKFHPAVHKGIHDIVKGLRKASREDGAITHDEASNIKKIYGIKGK